MGIKHVQHSNVVMCMTRIIDVIVMNVEPIRSTEIVVITMAGVTVTDIINQSLDLTLELDNA